MPCASGPSDQSFPANVYPYTATSELTSWGNLFQTLQPLPSSLPGPWPWGPSRPQSPAHSVPTAPPPPQAPCAMCMPDSPHTLEALGLLWPWPLYLWWPLFWASLWLSGKESTCQCRRPSSIPGSGRSPGGGNGNPLQYPDLENPMDRGAWGLSPQGHIGLDMTEWPNSCLVCPFSHPTLAQNSLSLWKRPPLPVSLQPSQPSSFQQRRHSPLLTHLQCSSVPSYREAPEQASCPACFTHLCIPNSV